MEFESSNRIKAGLLAILMFLTSTGFAVDFHYCQGQLKNLSLWGKAKTCQEMASGSHCHKKEKKSCHSTPTQSSCHAEKSDHKGCCENELAFIQMDADYGISEYVHFNAPTITFVSAFISTFYLDFLESEILIPDHTYYKPPIPDRDIIVLIQSFLC